MRYWLFGIGIFAGALWLAAPAAAQNYPWCAYYGGMYGDGGTNCGFTTREQCMEALSGNGGSCDLNTQYVPPPGPHEPRVLHARSAPRRHRHHHSQE